MLLDFVFPMPSTGPDLWAPKRKRLSGGAGRIFRDTEISAGSQRMRQNSSGNKEYSWLNDQTEQRQPVQDPTSSVVWRSNKELTENRQKLRLGR